MSPQGLQLWFILEMKQTRSFVRNTSPIVITATTSARLQRLENKRLPGARCDYIMRITGTLAQQN